MYRVLIAEDEPILLSNLGEILRMMGMQTELAYDGQKALEMLQDMKVAGDLPDLVLSDIMMPNLDGYGLLEAIRSDPDLQDLPFVVLSARSDSADLKKAFLMGVSDYIVKPFEVSTLVEVAEKHLAGRGARREGSLFSGTGQG